jgi:hypothetical protein
MLASQLLREKVLARTIKAHKPAHGQLHNPPCGKGENFPRILDPGTDSRQLEPRECRCGAEEQNGRGEAEEDNKWELKRSGKLRRDKRFRLRDNTVACHVFSGRHSEAMGARRDGFSVSTWIGVRRERQIAALEVCARNVD